MWADKVRYGFAGFRSTASPDRIAKSPVVDIAHASSDDDGSIEHVMLSYNWDHQVTIKRINASLQARS